MSKPVNPALPPCDIGFEWKRLPHNARVREKDVFLIDNSKFDLVATNFGEKAGRFSCPIYRQYPIKNPPMYRYFRHALGNFGKLKDKEMRYNTKTKIFEIISTDGEITMSIGWTEENIVDFLRRGVWIEIKETAVAKPANRVDVEKQLDELRSKIGKLKKTFDEQVHLILMDINALNFDLSFNNRK